MADVTISYNYYEDPISLKAVLDWHKNDHVPGINFTIIDDGSSKHPLNADQIPPHWNIYRITEDVGWNNEGAKNLAMHVSDTEWNLIGDADHPVRHHSVRSLPSLVDTLDPTIAYRPVRMVGKKRGINCFLLTKTLFWDIGGYDETYQGLYGYDCTLDFALKERDALNNHFETVELDAIADRSTLTRTQKTAQCAKFWEKHEAVKNGEIEADPRRLKFTWERVR